MKRLLVLLALLVPTLASAQVAPYPFGVAPPIFGLPASSVNGGGTFTGQLFGPGTSCATPAYAFTGSVSTGLGSDVANAWCLSANGTAILRGTATAVTSTVPLTLPNGTAAAPSLSFAVAATKGIYSLGTNGVGISSDSTGVVSIDTIEWQFKNNQQLNWSSGAIGAASDLFLTREAAAVLQMGLDAAGVTDQMFKGPDRITSDGVGGNLTIAGGRNRGASAGGSLIFQTAPAAGAGVTGTLTNAAIIDTTGAFTLVGKVVAEGAIGVPVVAKVGRITAQSTNATIATLTTPAVDGSYEVSANMNVTASTTLITTLTCTYTDESNTARTMIFPVASLAGSFIAAGAITGAGATVWETPMMHIRVKASTAITILTSAGTFTGVTYTADAVIKQMK